jgi:Rieske Fe-S protein
MACEDCLNRRAFLAKTALAGAAAALAAGCGNGIFGPPLPSHAAGSVPSGQLTITVSDFPGLANVGTLVQVGVERAAVRTQANPAAFIALSLICTHQGCDAAVQSPTLIECPCHGSQFSNDGSVVRGPAQLPLARISTSYDPQTDQLTIG